MFVVWWQRSVGTRAWALQEGSAQLITAPEWRRGLPENQPIIPSDQVWGEELVLYGLVWLAGAPVSSTYLWILREVAISSRPSAVASSSQGVASRRVTRFLHALSP